MARTVGDVMTPTPCTLDADASVVAAARARKDRDIGAVVVTRDGKVHGIVTDRDIVVRGLAAGRDPATTPVGEICSDDLAVVSPSTSVTDAIELMRAKAVRRIPVVKRSMPVGILSLGDVAVERAGDSTLAGISATRANR